MTRILVADDTPVNRRLLAALFEAEGFEVGFAVDGEAAVSSVAATPPDVVLLDVHMPVLDGLGALAKIKALAPEVPVIMLTSHGEVSTAVEAIRRGAHDFLVRPLANDRVVLTVRRALETSRLSSELNVLRKRLQAEGALRLLSGRSPGMQEVVRRIEQVARTKLTVLITGETGTGKELAARALHQESDRKDQPFVAIDCGAIPSNLIESELFGHEKGAFSGAERAKEGRFKLARGGTVFLDEVGNLAPELQPKLLRAIQERRVTPVGAASEVPIDARFIAATNEDLEFRVKSGAFRQDLYYRLAEITIELPPLRERKEDLIPLSRRFLEEAALELRKSVSGISDAAAEVIVKHPWPGNVRELRNVIRRAVLDAEGVSIEPEQLAPVLTKPTAAIAAEAPNEIPLGLSLKEIGDLAAAEAEKRAILDALKRSQGNKSAAARMLQVDFKTLHLKMKRYKLSAEGLPTNP